MDADRPDFAHAFEDLPEEARQQAAEIAQTEPGISLRRRIRDEIETFGLDSYGTLEEARLLHFLSRYPVTSYTYAVSGLVARGQRPDAAKLARLADGGRYRCTVNLCAEMADGDSPEIAKAGLAGVLQTHHIPVTDMLPPTVDQVTQLLDLLSAPDCELTYVHCEAGKGRTGVAIACYRMAVTGWSTADALTEAVNFGCVVPGQQAFIREFGQTLQAGQVARRYPLVPFGSVHATPAQLSATIHTAAKSPEAKPPEANIDTK
jgi:protein-tyrosine phosphatase